MQIIDRVQFTMPKDREMLFAAMSVLQQFVNEYQERMAMNDAGQGYRYKLQYGTDIPDSEWELFRKLDFQLIQEPETLNGYDMLADFSDERLAMFKDSGKHACQALGVMCGVTTTPLPDIRRVQPNQKKVIWGAIRKPGFVITGQLFVPIEDDELLTLKDGEVTGIIGPASWQTYLAASYGLPVIEFIPDIRPLMWLSKWTNPWYRAITGIGSNEPMKQVSSAIENIAASLGLVKTEEVT